MSNIGQMLDLNQLKNSSGEELFPLSADYPWIKKLPHKISIPVTVISLLAWFVGLAMGTGLIWYKTPIIAALIFIITTKSNSINDKFQIKDNGLVIPYTWLTTKTISWKEIVRVEKMKVTTSSIEEPLDAIEIVLDTSLIKFNTSGLEDTAIYITANKYRENEWNSFFNKLDEVLKKEQNVPDTLAERITKQVNKAWNNRWKRFLLTIAESTSKVIFYYLLLEILLYSIFGISTIQLVFIILFSLIMLYAVLLHLSTVPSAVVGIRPNELGPLLYNENDILTNVRLTTITYPYPIKIVHAEMIYNEESLMQSERLKQIEPKIISPGELKHVIIQVWGNHTKANGVKIRFKYEQNSDKTEYVITQKWN